VKILNVISTMDPARGGPSQGIRNSTKELYKLGIQREVLCLDDPGADFLAGEAFPVHAVGPAKGPWFYSPGLVPWLLKNIGRFDAVIVNGLWLYHGYAVLKVIKRLKDNAKANADGIAGVPKLFIMPHGMLDPYFQRTSGRKIKALRNRLYWKLIERKIIGEADGVFFTCETELILARETFISYYPKKEYNVGYGIISPPAYTAAIFDAFLNRCPDIGLNNSYILFLSRIHEKKGVDLLIKAYTYLLKQYREMPKLVIAGPGLETAFGNKIKQMADESRQINKTIFFAGMLTGDAKWGALYGCEAFILPSHQENFGISVAEALACGKPVLISDQINIWREIEAGKAGFIAHDTFEGVVQLLKDWIHLEKKGKEKMSSNALAAYKDNFEIFPAAKKFANVLFSANT